MDDASRLLSKLSSEGPEAELALRELFFAHGQALVGFARRYVGDRDTAEDVVQNVFLGLWRNRQTLKIETDIKSYLFTATRNQALNILRHSKTAQDAEAAVRLTIRESEVPVDRVEYEQVRDRIEKAVNSLPEQTRRVFMMSRLDGLTYAQIASVLGISVKTVETLMGRALKHIRTSIAVILAGVALVRLFRFFL